MENFSSLNKKDFTRTKKDKVIDNASNLSGLDRNNIEKLFESFSYDSYQDYDKINESFENYFSEDVIDFEKFKKDINKITKSIDNINYDEDRRKIFNNKLLKILEEHLNHKPDVPLLLEIICFMLNLKNRDRRNNLFENFVFGQKFTQLFECDKSNNFDVSDWDVINVNPVNTIEKNILNAKEDIHFYQDMRLLLSKYSKSYGNNYHINDIYSVIVEYIDKESEYLSNYGKTQEFDSMKYNEFIETIVNDKANAMDMNVDLIKTNIPDLQKLLFDLVVLFNCFVEKNKENQKFIDIDLVRDYQKYRDILLDTISSSRFNSLVYENYDYRCKISSVGALDSLNIIKSIQNEFNLKIRKIINVYFTKSSEIFIKLKQLNIQKQSLNY